MQRDSERLGVRKGKCGGVNLRRKGKEEKDTI